MRSKLMKIATIGLFAVAMLLNVSVYFDANDSQNADLSLGSLKVSLFQKAYAGEWEDDNSYMCYGCNGPGCLVIPGYVFVPESWPEPI